MVSQSPPLRILFLADSHLGFDLPTRPRVDRRRRGHDFQSNHEEALAPAMRGEVDLVVHGGDVFHRSKVPPSLAYQAFKPLLQIAEAGVPVFVVPGNHERSRIPHHRFAAHPNLHIFREPGTFLVEAQGLRVALSGFPYVRRGVRDRFPAVLEETGWKQQKADIRLLCFHHCVEGATVGPSDYTFRHASDVIRCSDLPPDFAAVLSGHIHRHQVLREDLQGRPLLTPVLYPGSVERTAFAEKDEVKGFLILEVGSNDQGGQLVGSEFVPLPARPMVLRDLHPSTPFAGEWRPEDLSAQLQRAIEESPKEAVLRIRIHGWIGPELNPLVAAGQIRTLTPPGTNVEVRLSDGDGSRGRGSPGFREQRGGGRGDQRAVSPESSAEPPVHPLSSQPCLDFPEESLFRR